MRLKVVGTRRVPSTSSKRRNELRDYKQHFVNNAALKSVPVCADARNIYAHPSIK